MEKKSKKTGNVYKEFNFKFNFAIKDLLFAELLTFTNSSPVTLTEKGLYLDIDGLDVEKDIIEASAKYWNELSQKNKKNKASDASENEEEPEAEEKSKMISRNGFLQQSLKCHQKNLRHFHEHYSIVWVLNSPKKVFRLVMMAA